MKVSEKELGTIIYSLEEYQQLLDKEGSIETRNYVMELIWKLSNKGEGK